MTTTYTNVDVFQNRVTGDPAGKPIPVSLVPSPCAPSLWVVRRWKITGAIYEYFSNTAAGDIWAELPAGGEQKAPDPLIIQYVTPESAQEALKQWMLVSGELLEIDFTAAGLRPPAVREDIRPIIAAIFWQLSSAGDSLPWAVWKREAARRGARIAAHCRLPDDMPMNPRMAEEAFLLNGWHQVDGTPERPADDGLTRFMVRFSYLSSWGDFKEFLAHAAPPVRFYGVDGVRDSAILCPRDLERRARASLVEWAGFDDKFLEVFARIKARLPVESPEVCRTWKQWEELLRNNGIIITPRAGCPVSDVSECNLDYLECELIRYYYVEIEDPTENEEGSDPPAHTLPFAEDRRRQRAEAGFAIGDIVTTLGRPYLLRRVIAMEEEHLGYKATIDGGWEDPKGWKCLPTARIRMACRQTIKC